MPSVIQAQSLTKAFNPSSIDPRNPKELNYILHVPHRNLIKVEDLYKEKTIQKKAGTHEYISDLDDLPPFVFIIDPKYIRDNDGEWMNNGGSSWKDEIRRFKLDIFNSYSEDFGNTYATKFGDIWIRTKETINGKNTIEMGELKSTLHSRNLEELDTIPIDMLKYYYTKKLSERYSIPFNKNNLDEYFTISFETPDGTSMTNIPASEGFQSGKYIDFKYFVKNSLGNVIIDNNDNWSGADEANAGDIFLGHYISRHLGQDAKSFVYDTKPFFFKYGFYRVRLSFWRYFWRWP